MKIVKIPVTTHNGVVHVEAYVDYGPNDSPDEKMFMAMSYQRYHQNVFALKDDLPLNIIFAGYYLLNVWGKNTFPQPLSLYSDPIIQYNGLYLSPNTGIIGACYELKKKKDIATSKDELSLYTHLALISSNFETVLIANATNVIDTIKRIQDC